MKQLIIFKDYSQGNIAVTSIGCLIHDICLFGSINAKKIFRKKKDDSDHNTCNWHLKQSKYEKQVFKISINFIFENLRRSLSLSKPAYLVVILAATSLKLFILCCNFFIYLTGFTWEFFFSWATFLGVFAISAKCWRIRAGCYCKTFLINFIWTIRA